MLDLVVLAKRKVADRMVELVLCSPDGTDLPAWPLGAHIDLVLPQSRIRPYSLCGDPADRTRWRVLVRHEHFRQNSTEASASRYIHDHLAPGDRIGCRGPHDRFRLVGASSFAFLASGAGIAPLLPMARAIAAARIYPWSLVYMSRDDEEGPLRREVSSLGPRATVVSEYDLDRTFAAAAPSAAVYVCGGSNLVDRAEVAAAQHPRVSLHRQRFDAPSRTGGASCDVLLARRGERIHVPAETSLLTALRANGIDVPFSCGAGICGACVVAVLSGRVEHRDSILTRAERDAGSQVVTCVSRAADHHLTLDL
ncbi:iron-sulfur cluster-binding domain-containing protein [Nocardia sp. NBC_01377]|uniref:flavin reductase family protein n=1 Tax=Nocardia sp. NBC_01377 TaxID=2903595 RepID=UPI00324EFFB9